MQDILLTSIRASEIKCSFTLDKLGTVITFHIILFSIIKICALHALTIENVTDAYIL